MTVCFAFDPNKEPWITPFDRRDTRNNPVPDGKISTYDVKAVWNRQFLWSATNVWDNDEKLCDAFFVETLKLEFFNEVIRPQTEEMASLWRKRDAVLDRIAKRQVGKMPDEMWECDWMGECHDNMFVSAKKFVNCVANGVVKDANGKTPDLASIGITLTKKPGELARIDDAIPEAHHILFTLGVLIMADVHPYVASINGQSTLTMTEAEMAAALSGPEGTYVSLEIAEYEYSDDKKVCSAEPKVITVGALKRTISLGPVMTKCGGIDL